MSALLAYTVHTGFFLLAGYIVFKWVMAGEKQSRLNRAALLGIYVLSFAAYPLAGLFGGALGGHGMAQVGGIEFEGMGPAVAAEGVKWRGIITAVYMAGLAAAALWSLATGLRIAALIRCGRRENRGSYTLVLLPEGRVAPFSWGRYVVMGVDDYALAGDIIVEHELGHLRARHCLDMMLAQAVCVVCWYNPASWLLREELKGVHEYEADEHVLASGVEPRRYQMLLIKKAVGLRFQSLANSLNHSKLKKRITMMYNQKSRAGRRLRGLALVPALAVALAAVNTPVVASALAGLRTAEIDAAPAMAQTTAVKDTKNSAPEAIQDKPDTYAMYPGGQGAMFKFLIDKMSYPAEEAKAGRQGRVVVKFTVQSDGTIDDITIDKSVSPALDAEAVRVVSLMPKWVPATVGGKPCASYYVLPVTFSLARSTSDQK